MSKIRINSIKLKNYRSFGEPQHFVFPNENCLQPIAIVGYNNSGKTNLMNAIKYGLYENVREDTFSISDFHNCSWENVPKIHLNFTALIGNHFSANEEYTNKVEFTIKDEQVISVFDKCHQLKVNKK